jgi:hypothetical protein
MKNVNHDFKYHCEIQYETQHAFDFTKAVGKNFTELIKDIETILEKYKSRSPKIVEAIYDPNKTRLNITSKVLIIMKQRPTSYLYKPKKT